MIVLVGSLKSGSGKQFQNQTIKMNVEAMSSLRFNGPSSSQLRRLLANAVVFGRSVIATLSGYGFNSLQLVSLLLRAAFGRRFIKFVPSLGGLSGKV